MVGYLTMQGGNSALNIVWMINVMYKAAFSSMFEAFGTAVKGYLLIDIINTFTTVV